MNVLIYLWHKKRMDDMKSITKLVMSTFIRAFIFLMTVRTSPWKPQHPNTKFPDLEINSEVFELHMSHGYIHPHISYRLYVLGYSLL